MATIDRRPSAPPSVLPAALLSAAATVCFAASAEEGASAPPKVAEARNEAFPPPGTSHYLAGELVFADHVNRMAVLRPDRLDAHDKSHLDLPHHLDLPPYGSVHYHGAPAELRDVPLGTHLHGWFCLGERGEYRVDLQPSDYFAQVRNRPNRRSPDSQYSRALRLEDDFTFYQRQGAVWEIVSVDLEVGKLVAERRDSGEPSLPPGYPEARGLSGRQTFDLDSATRVWKGEGFGDLSDLSPGGSVLFNLTWATLYGPGRITDLWLDPEAAAAAAERQRRVHFEHQRVRGVPALIEEVEHGEGGSGEVVAVFTAGTDDSVLERFSNGQSGSLIVVEASLRSHGQGSDARPVRFLEFSDDPEPPPGSSGRRVRFHMGELLEGVRPGRTVRLQAPGWPRSEVPREERLWPSDIRPAFLDSPAPAVEEP